MPVAEQIRVISRARLSAAFLGILMIAVNLRAAFVTVGPVLADMGAEFSWSGSTAGLLAGLPLISFAVFSPVAPGLARRLGLDRALGLSLFCAYAGLSLAPQFTLLWVVVGALGCGSLIVVALSLFSLRAGNHQQVASLSGMAQSVGYTIAAAGPVAFGALRDVSGSSTLPLTATSMLMLILCVMAVLSGRNRVIS